MLAVLVEEPGFSRASAAEIEKGFSPEVDDEDPSREAAKDCSPRRKPWVAEKKENQPRRGERNVIRNA